MFLTPESAELISEFLIKTESPEFTKFAELTESTVCVTVYFPVVTSFFTWNVASTFDVFFAASLAASTAKVKHERICQVWEQLF